MEYLFIYLLQIADLIGIFACVFLAFGICFIMILLILWLLNFIASDKCTDEIKSDMIYIGEMSLFMIIPAIILFLIPSRETMLLMGGTYIGKKAINATINNEAFKKANNIINLQLDEYIKKLERTN